MFRTINSNRPSDLIDTGFALIKVLDYIRNNDFPSFKKALNEGLNPNTSIPHFGSFLTLSIMSGCAKCVEALIDRGVDVMLRSLIQLQFYSTESRKMSIFTDILH
jgi:hypothetical protein